MKLKQLILPLLAIAFQSCYLHHANVAGDGYGTKQIIDFSGKPNYAGALPVRIEFDLREREFVKEYLKRKGQNIEVSDNLIDSYYSEEIISRFRNSNLFFHDHNANVKIRVVSTIEEVKAPVLSLIASVGTLFIFPMITRTYGRVEFEIFDSEKRKLLKTFKYPIEHRSYQGFSSIIFGSFFPLFSDRFDHSTNEKNFAIMRVAFNQFESDLKVELNKDAAMSKRFFKNENLKYALLPFQAKNEKDPSIYSRLYAGLEQGFLERGIFLVERNKLNQLIEEIKFSKSGLTESNRLQFGKFLSANRLIIVTDADHSYDPAIVDLKMGFSIKCLDVNTGTILWSNRFQYDSFKKNSLDEHLNSFVYEILSEMKLKGEI